MIIDLLRHGQTDYNLTKRVQGNTAPARLTRLGLLQAVQRADTLNPADYDAVWSTDLPRGYLTAQVIWHKFARQGINLPLIQDPDLRERGWGSFTGLTFEDIGVTDNYDQWYACPSGGVLGGVQQPEDVETIPSVRSRVRGVAERAAKSGLDGILFVGHEFSNSYLLNELLEEPSDVAHFHAQPNCGMIRLEVDKNAKVLGWEYGPSLPR